MVYKLDRRGRRITYGLAILMLGLIFLVIPSFAKGRSKGEKEEQRKRKAISRQSVDMSANLRTKKPSGRKTDKAFANATSESSIRLLEQVTKKEKKNTNILIAPDSVWTAVSLVENGAAGKTRKEMEKVLGGISTERYNQYLYTLHQRISKSKSVRCQMANSIWYRKGKLRLSKTYVSRLASYHGAQTYRAPFDSGTVKDINAWAYNHTNGKIPYIIQNLSPDARLLALNAVYFKGAWQDPCQTTVKRTFAVNDKKKKKVSMLETIEHDYITIHGAKGFVKYYQGGQTAFVGLLPPKGTSPVQWIEGLSGEDFIKAYKKRKREAILVHTRIPEFTYEYESSLAKPLYAMGIKRAFGRKADFSAMTEEKVCLDDVIHKTYIKLNKKGTEAAAVTAITMKASSAFPPKKMTEKKVYLDRPFVYAIIDSKSGIPLFMGIVNDPSPAKK